MPNHEDKEDQHLITLDELEATQEQIRSYQGLLKDLPGIFEQKFNERLKPVLDRHQELMDERELLLDRLQQRLPAAIQENRSLLDPARSLQRVEANGDRKGWSGRFWVVLALTLLGGGFGLLLSKRLPSTPLPITTAMDQAEAGKKMSDGLRRRAVALALSEWTYFGMPSFRNAIPEREGRLEGDSGQWQRIRTYWHEGVSNPRINRREDIMSSANPWSAVFLSYVMKKAGAADRFPYGASPAVFIKSAIKDRVNKVSDPPLIALRPAEHSPAPGDLICAIPQDLSGQVSLNEVPSLELFPSRCDLVVSNAGHTIEAIGGDISDAVSLRKLSAVDGKLAPLPGEEWLAVIQTNLH
jgi:hypothetical protein